MRLLDHNGAILRSLTPAEQAMVEAFALGQAQGRELLQANRWLMGVRAEGQWLGCECRTDSMPVLNVTLNGHTGTLSLHSNPGTAEHAPRCPFAQHASDNAEHGTPKALAWRAPDVPLRLLADFNAAPASHERDGLLEVLLTWLEAAGLNVYSHAGKPSLGEQFGRLRQVAARYPLVERVPAAHYLETRLDMKHMMMLKSRLASSTAFGRHRRHGLLLDCVSDVRGRKVFTTTDKRFDLQGHHLLWGGARASGPLLAMALYSPAQPGSHFYELIHAATVPVLSRQLMFPVFRDEEREPLQALVRLVDWMAGKGVAVTLRRPVVGGQHMDELLLSANGDRVLSVSLTGQPRGPEPKSDTFKRLADFKSPETFNKYVAGFFMRGRT